MARHLIEAIRNGDQSQARNILLGDRYGCIDCQTAKRDGTALFWACAKGYVELVHLLIAKGAGVNARTNYNSTPLIAAADSNRYQVVRILIEQGADLNAQTSNGDTACHQAAYRGHVEAVKLLVAHGADVDIPNAKFRTAFDEAARQGHVDLLPFLDGSVKLGTSRAALKVSLPSLPHRRLTGGRGGANTRIPSTHRMEPPRRDSCDGLSHESLSRESSYEDCGQTALIINAYDLTEHLCAGRDMDLAESDRYYTSSHPSSFQPSHLSFPTTAHLSFPTSNDLSFASTDLSFAASSLPYSYSDVATNDLSLPSERTSSKKSTMSRLNIPA